MREFAWGFCSMLAICGGVFAAVWVWLNRAEKRFAHA